MLPLFAYAHQLLLCCSPQEKLTGVTSLYNAFFDQQLRFDENTSVSEDVVAGLPPQLLLVAPKLLKRRRIHSLAGRAAMLHAIVHIEFNAINIALDAIYRFRGMPFAYYVDWLRVAREEAYHFHLLVQHLQNLGYQYGDFPAHLGLWEMVQKTGYDVLARMALVPRLLEARGLDVTPDIIQRLLKVNDKIAAEILSIIYHDEIGHVRVGNYWYHYLCQQRKLEPIETFVTLLNQHAADYLRGPLRLESRRQAGFQEKELDLLFEIVLNRTANVD